jgi:hypothetical protein
VSNDAVGERKDWLNSRKCPVNACRLQKEYIISVDTPYPDDYRQKKALTDVASAQVIRHRGLSVVGLTAHEIACGRFLSGALPRQDRTKPVVAGVIQ